MDQEIGTCSICGGPVVGHSGPWWAVVPPPPARCTRCGAQEARGPVIPMVPGPGPVLSASNIYTTDNTNPPAPSGASPSITDGGDRG